jgi:hypothetical protein
MSIELKPGEVLIDVETTYDHLLMPAGMEVLNALSRAMFAEKDWNSPTYTLKGPIKSIKILTSDTNIVNPEDTEEPK